MIATSNVLILVVTIAFLLFIFLFWRALKQWTKKQSEADGEEEIIRFLGAPSPLLTAFRRLRRTGFHPRIKIVPPRPGPEVFHPSLSITPKWQIASEFGAILLFALWVGKGMIQFHRFAWPNGGQFPAQIQSLYIWNVLAECGDCVFWNGQINGGMPAFADPSSPLLHPLVVVLTLSLGVVQSAKLILLLSLILAGVAQWWMARMLGCSALPRLWSAAVVIVGGHLSSKMDNGSVMLLFALTASSLAFPALLNILRRPGFRSVTVGGLLLGCAFLAGQRSILIANLFILIILACFSLRKSEQSKPATRYFAASVGLAFLISACFWVPFLRFWQNIGWGLDPNLSGFQPIGHIPLNLVLDNPNLFRVAALGHDRNLFANYLYIGWVPVLFSIIAVILAPQRITRWLLYLWLPVLFIFAISSRELATALLNVVPQIASLKNPGSMTGLAVPFIVWAAALGMQTVMDRYSGLFPVPIRHLKAFSCLPLGLLILAVVSLRPGIRLAQTWYSTSLVSYDKSIAAELASHPGEWVQPPLDDSRWLPPLLESNAKLTHIPHPWVWNERPVPDPYIKTQNLNDAASIPPGRMDKTIDQTAFIQAPKNAYTTLIQSGGILPCTAHAAGGRIDVECQADQDGVLVIKENSSPGWKVWVDGNPADLLPGTWLGVAVPKGSHFYSFRYQPWENRIGIGFTLAGLGLSVIFTLRKTKL